MSTALPKLTKCLDEGYDGESEGLTIVEQLLDLGGGVVVGGSRLPQLAGEGEHVLVLHEDAGGPEAGRQLEHLLQVFHLGRGALQVEVHEALHRGRVNQILVWAKKHHGLNRLCEYHAQIVVDSL